MNPFTTTSARVDKLLAQYAEHKSLVIGVDFDFTLYDTTSKYMYTYIVDLILEAQHFNCKLCLWSANDDTRVSRIIDECSKYGLIFDYINESPIDLGVKTIKPHFNLLLDDTAGLGQAIEILQAILKELKCTIQNNVK